MCLVRSKVVLDNNRQIITVDYPISSVRVWEKQVKLIIIYQLI